MLAGGGGLEVEKRRVVAKGEEEGEVIKLIEAIEEMGIVAVLVWRMAWERGRKKARLIVKGEVE